MMTVQEAYERALSAQKRQNALSFILLKIKEAADRGETSLIYEDPLDFEVVESLSKLGFRVWSNYTEALSAIYEFSWDLSDSKEYKEK